MASERPVRIGVIGAGSMGSLHARVVAGDDATELVWVVDADRARGEQIATRFGTRWSEQPDLSSVDAVVVAAPTQFHHDIATPIIDARIPLLLEKPLGDTIDETRALIDAARRSGSVLMCGLLERFNPAVRTVMDIVRDPLLVATQRHSPYAARIATGVGGDLLSHDVDMVMRLFGEAPVSVSGRCGYFDPRSRPGSEDVVEASIGFDRGRLATLSASRLSQRKVRSVVVTELDRLIEVDLLRQDITIYRHVLTTDFDEDAGYSQQTIIDIPVVRHLGEPLQLQLAHFVGLVRGVGDRERELDGLLAPHEVVAAVVADGARVAAAAAVAWSSTS
jgi:predicted dehydrogenase